MPVEVIGIDHIYVAVRDLDRSAGFYDPLMEHLGFRRWAEELGGQPHVHYYNRHFGYTLRPALPEAPDHQALGPGLHHFCFRVLDESAVDRAAAGLVALGIEVRGPRLFPEYAPDYYAVFFDDPDGVRLEITNFREDRRRRMYDWEQFQRERG